MTEPADSPALAAADLEVVVALQKTELDRLLRDNARLNDRVDKLLAMQEREQVLRQELQGLIKTAESRRRREIAGQNGVAAERRRNRRLKQALVALVSAVERDRRQPRA